MLGSLVEQSSEWYFDISKIILKLIISKSKFTFSTGTLSNCWDYDNFWTYTCVRYSLLLGKEEISIYRKWIHTAAEWHDSMRPCMSCQWAGQALWGRRHQWHFWEVLSHNSPCCAAHPPPITQPVQVWTRQQRQVHMRTHRCQFTSAAAMFKIQWKTLPPADFETDMQPPPTRGWLSTNHFSFPENSLHLCCNISSALKAKTLLIAAEVSWHFWKEERFI